MLLHFHSQFDSLTLRIYDKTVCYLVKWYNSKRWRRQEVSFGGKGPGCMGMQVPSGVQGRSPPPGRGSGGLCPLEAETDGRHRLLILTAETITILKISHNSPPDA